MRFTANRELLYEAVKTVLKTVSPNKDIPEISGVLIEANAETGVLTLTGTDVRTHIQCRLRQEHIEEGGSIILTPIISDMLRLLDGDTVAFQDEGRLIDLRSGNCSYTMSYLNSKSFPKLQIPFPEDTIQIKGINSLVKRTAIATDCNNTDQTKMSFAYVKLNFENGIAKAEATDGNCIAVSVSPHCADGNLEMILHEKALQTLVSIVKPSEELYVGIVDKFAIFMKEDMIFSTMLFSGEFLEASDLIEKVNFVYKATADAKEMYELIDNVSSVFSSNDDKCVNIKLENDALCAQTKTSACISTSSINVVDFTPIPNEGFHYVPKRLTDCLRHMTGPIKLRFDNRGFLLMEANGSKYFVCPRGPVRIVKKEEEKGSKTKTKSTKSKSAAAKAA